MNTILEALHKLNEDFEKINDHYEYRLGNKTQNECHGHVALNTRLLSDAIEEDSPVYYNLSLEEYENAAKSLATAEYSSRFDASKTAVNAFIGGKYNGVDCIYKYTKTKHSPYPAIQQKLGQKVFEKAHNKWETLYDLVIIAIDGKENTSDPTIYTFYLATQAKLDELKQIRNDPVDGQYIGGNRKAGKEGEAVDSLNQGNIKFVIVDYLYTYLTAEQSHYLSPRIVICPVTKITHGKAGNGSDNIEIQGKFGTFGFSPVINAATSGRGKDVQVAKRIKTDLAMDDFANRCFRECNKQYNLLRKASESAHYNERKEKLQQISFWATNFEDADKKLNSIRHTLQSIYNDTVYTKITVGFEEYFASLQQKLLMQQDNLNKDWTENK